MTPSLKGSDVAYV